ncbi:hypothetical protein BU15DRAFT_88220 [Melanogaster broomeanus]|nr:hypothetical protein BU15DRAFT_88220 [Melanogaster broomeanus]
MADSDKSFLSLQQLSAETRAKLRSTQILTSLPNIISELLQNSIDAGASQIDIGVDCGEWSCWVMDNGSGFTKDGLSKIGQDSEHGRTMKPVAHIHISTAALSSMADMCCLEISSRTTRSRESWSVIVKAGKPLYIGPSLRWRRESPGTVVSVRDAFFSLPVRRLSHPSPSKTIDIIRQELEAYALVFPDVSISFQDSSKAREGSRHHKLHILKIPKVTDMPHSDPPCSYINRHLLSFCDLHRLIDSRFAASTFAKHVRPTHETLPAARRPPRKGEKRPIYVLNLIIPVRHIDKCLDPAKSVVQLDNKNVVTSFLSATIQSFLIRHSFAPDNRTNDGAEDGSPRKKRKLVTASPLKSNTPTNPGKFSRSGTPGLFIYPEKISDSNLHKTVWKDPATGETFIIDNRTGNSHPQTAPSAVGTDGPIEVSSQRRTLRASHLTAQGKHHDESENTVYFRKEDLQKARVISQVDRKFIACLVDGLPTDGNTLILIDQHAADERVRVERFLKTICCGFLCHQEGSGTVETKRLSPPVPVLLTQREASRLSEVLAYQKSFESWGFQFSGLQDVRVTRELETEPDGDAGYTQIFVSAIPEVVGQKLLLGDELQGLIRGYLDKESQWVKALRWCPRELLDLINSKACRGAIMFNDPLNSEQCERLVKQLSATIFPFQCAHGRYLLFSHRIIVLVPLCSLPMIRPAN